MKKILTILFISTLIISCSKKNENLEKTRILKYYSDTSGTIFSKTIKYKGYDSLFYFYKNGNLFKKGKIRKNGKPYGIWNLYSESSNLREIREWYIINGHSRINRVWFLDEKGDTLAWRYQDSIFNQKEFLNDTLGIRTTSYNSIYFRKDTLEYNEPMRAYAYLGSPLLSEKNSQAMVIIGKSKNNFNEDFSNEDQVKLDTFYNLTVDKDNQKWFKDVEQKYFTVFSYYFENSGEKTIRGYLLEFATGDFENGVDSLTHRTYFEKIIYVKDSLE